MHLTLPIVTFAALLDSINPCAISVLLLTIGFLLSARKSRREILSIASVYILGIFITYFLIGLGLLQALNLFGLSHLLVKIGASILIASAVLDLLGKHLGLPAFIKPQLANQIQKSTYPAMYILGTLVGLFEFPCTGGPYLMILTLLRDRTTQLSGALYLIYYNVIFILPLVLILLASGNDRLSTLLRSRTTQKFTSLAMLILGIVILLL